MQTSRTRQLSSGIFTPPHKPVSGDNLRQRSGLIACGVYEPRLETPSFHRQSSNHTGSDGEIAEWMDRRAAKLVDLEKLKNVFKRI